MAPSQGHTYRESAATTKAVQASKKQWIGDLKTLLAEAERRFGDVAWSIEGEDTELYGHKAILYARANAAFQAKYLSPNGSARLQAIMSGSDLSLANLSSNSPSYSIDQSSAEDAVVQGKPKSSKIIIKSREGAFFKALLDFLYTGSSDISEVFEFLFEDATFAQDKDARQDRLAQDMLFVWRSKLFADVQIGIRAIHGEIPDENAPEEPSTAKNTIFATHRAFLSVRCPYFSSIFLSPYSDSEASMYTLPSPPFTPASLHYTLAYIYTGSLALNRIFHLHVAMEVWTSAQYLSMDLMKDEIECRIADMCHGYQGCCKLCRTRITRVFAFANEPDVQSSKLQSFSRHVVLKHFGEVWGREVGELPYAVQKGLVLDLCQNTAAVTASDALASLCQVRDRIDTEHASWADHLRSMLLPLEERIRWFLQNAFADIITSKSFDNLLEGIGFSSDVLETMLKLLVGTLDEKTAAQVYEVLVGKVLLRDKGIKMDARARVEDARHEILAYLKKRWLAVRAANGFEVIETWALKEISDEIGQPVDDLLQTYVIETPTTKTGLRLASTAVHRVKSDDYSTFSVPASLRASILNRNAARKDAAAAARSISSISVNAVDGESPAPLRRSSQALNSRQRTVSSGSKKSVAITSGPRTRVVSGPQPRTTNDMATASPSPTSIRKPNTKAPPLPSTSDIGSETKDPLSKGRIAVSAGSPAPIPTTGTPTSSRPNGTQTLRKVALSSSKVSPEVESNPVPSQSQGANARRARISSASAYSRPASVSSVRSRTTLPAKQDAQFKSVARKAVGPRVPNVSTSSAGNSPSAPSTPSNSSSNKSKDVRNGTTNTKSRSNTLTSTQRSLPGISTARPPSSASTITSPTSKEPSTTASSKKGIVTSDNGSIKRAANSRSGPRASDTKVPLVPRVAQPHSIQKRHSAEIIPKVVEPASPDDTPDGITPASIETEPASINIPGTTLKVGIPCVVTASNHQKIRATVRYVGEVLFAEGTYVGVEVPMSGNGNEDILTEDSAGYSWNDGTVDGVKYFELESQRPSSPFLERIQARRAGLPPTASSSSLSIVSTVSGRRTPLSEPSSSSVKSRGLFIDPSQGGCNDSRLQPYPTDFIVAS